MANGEQPSPSFPTPARLVLTLGLHGSASTWVYNVARELMTAAFGADGVLACFANSPVELLRERGAIGRRVVCKTHGWPNLDVFADLAAARVVATVRDPRDAVVSLMERFGTAPEAAAHGIAQDCVHIVWCAAAGHPVLRYEDRFFDAPDAVAALARHLGFKATAADTARIFAAYRTEAVRAFAAGVPMLPATRLVDDGRVFQFDRVTQIHRRHIGDGRVGKWRERLAPALQVELSRLFAPFLARFGYAPA
jgi:hypothetical protein